VALAMLYYIAERACVAGREAEKSIFSIGIETKSMTRKKWQYKQWAVL